MRGSESSPKRKAFSGIAWSGIAAFIVMCAITLFTDYLGTDTIDGFFL